jgi:hypothetical protein
MRKTARMRRITFSIIGFPDFEAVAAGDVKECEGEEGDGGDYDKDVGHDVFLRRVRGGWFGETWRESLEPPGSQGLRPTKLVTVRSGRGGRRRR